MTIAQKSRVLALTLAFPLLSCQSQGPMAPTPQRPVTVQISGPTSAIFAQQGDLRVAAFDVWICETNGRPAAGVPVELFVRRGPGEIIPAEAISDYEGRIRALFAVFVPPEDCVAQIAAKVFDETTFCSIKVPAGPVPEIEDIAPGMGAAVSRLLEDLMKNRSGR